MAAVLKPAKYLGNFMIHAMSQNGSVVFSNNALDLILYSNAQIAKELAACPSEKTSCSALHPTIYDETRNELSTLNAERDDHEDYSIIAIKVTHFQMLCLNDIWA